MTTGAAPAKPPRLYFVNAFVDYALIGGASLVLFAVFYFSGYKARTNPVIQAGIVLMWIINWPHFSATSWRLYHSKANIAQYPVTAIAIPILVLTGVIASFSSPAAIAPCFVKLFLLWSPYHFSGQSLGISLIYARRSGIQVGRLDRLAFSAFIFGTFFFSSARGEVGTGSYPYFGIDVPRLGLPAWVAYYAEIGLLACAVGLAAVVIRWCVVNRRLVPPIVLLPALSQFIWFVPSGVASFNEFVPFFHSLQYMLIAWSMQLKEKMDEDGIAPSGGYVLSESARWGAANFVGGMVLFYALPRVGVEFGFPLLVAEPIIISAVQIHHFFVDGVIWKLRNPKVGSPLLVNLDDMLREPAKAAA
jgi:hypothetical protein